MRDDTSKEYRALYYLKSLNGHEIKASRLIQAVLDELSASVRLTSEWYEYQQNRMVITRRSEPAKAFILVLARIGYQRTLNQELDAVARIALACGCTPESGEGYWETINGNKTPVSKKQAQAKITDAKAKKVAIDMEWNQHGVRRMAAPVKRSDGSLVGVVALAQSFSPAADDILPACEKTLERAVLTLEQNDIVCSGSI
jgi:DNA-binding IclR family transcriptional regulator